MIEVGKSAVKLDVAVRPTERPKDAAAALPILQVSTFQASLRPEVCLSPFLKRQTILDLLPASSDLRRLIVDRHRIPGATFHPTYFLGGHFWADASHR